MESSGNNDYDVVIIGAGISGINAAYRIQTTLPDFKYTILESRGAIGGTWDLFRYPGIRSDSDLYTFGFPWRPWPYDKAIAHGTLIRKYISESAAEYGIDKKIKFHHKLISADWASSSQSWQLSVDVDGETQQLRGKFIIFASGYYDFDEPLQTKIPGIENFKGTTVHPQFWPEDFDCTDKKVVIIGSGATAITLLPNLTEKATKVTILQRSPGYVLSMPSVDTSGQWVRKLLPSWMASRIIRLKFIVLPFLFFQFCRIYPNAAKRIIGKAATRQLPKSIPQDPNFKPSYNPWEQRLCICPDGDFYQALRDGKGDVVTDTIKTVTETGIETEHGTTLDADIIITATGLKMQLAGGSRVTIEGDPVQFNEKFMWKGTMVQDVPNAAVIIGYTNASWTLGAEATSQLVCRIFKYMQGKNMTSVVPRVKDGEEINETNLMNLSSTYVVKARAQLPKGGDRGPWKPRSNYFQDYWNAKFGNLASGLEFTGMEIAKKID